LQFSFINVFKNKPNQQMSLQILLQLKSVTNIICMAVVYILQF